MRTEIINWTPVAERLPDSDITVLVAMEGDNEPTWIAFWDGTAWRGAHNGGVLVGRVTDWADMPGGPRAC